MPEIRFERKTEFDPNKDDYTSVGDLRKNFTQALNVSENGTPFCILKHNEVVSALVTFDDKLDSVDNDSVKFISISDARLNLAEVMSDAAGGKKIVITHYGRPKSTMVSFDEYQSRMK